MKGRTKTVLLHENTEYVEDAAAIMAKEWNHESSNYQRNIISMKNQPVTHFPCHMALLLIFDESENTTNKDKAGKVVGHVKLMKADGRSDGACCIVYSLVVDSGHRGQGYGRLLMEEAEKYAQMHDISYVYLSTPDKASFYKHLGYLESEAVSSIGENSKRLSKTQIASLENLFAKRLAIDAPTSGNTWLRKRLIHDFPLIEAVALQRHGEVLIEKLANFLYTNNEKTEGGSYLAIINRTPWQQQAGPSCGIAALNMLHKYIQSNSKEMHRNRAKFGICECIKSEKQNLTDITDSKSAIDFAVKLGISYDGEMFCAHNLTYFANRFYKMNLKLQEVCDNTSHAILKSIAKGHPILLPYDRSLSNHKPGNHNGHQAHWALIVGVILKESNTTKLPRHPFESEHCSMILNLVDAIEMDTGNVDELLELYKGGNVNDFLLICVHGMSAQPFVCSYEALFASNHQLYETKSKFYLSADDLEHLRNKIIFVD